jgi:hypothetical protein
MFRSTHSLLLERERAASALAAFRAAQAESQAEYWRRRAELFLDRAAAKAGVSHEPVMRENPIAGIDPFAANPFGGIGISEIDSTREDGKVAS